MKKLCFAVALFLGASCEPPSIYWVKEPKAADLVGTWALSNVHPQRTWAAVPLPDNARETLVLRKDGTYSQSFEDGGAHDYAGASNKWKVRKDESDHWTLELQGFVYFDREFRSHQPPHNWEPQIAELIVYENDHDWVFAYQGPQEEPLFHRER